MDKYEKAIEYFKYIYETKSLEEFKKEVYKVWLTPYDYEQGCLFLPISIDPLDLDCGCPTQIKVGYLNAYTEELTELIKKNPNIPGHAIDIDSPDKLYAFAEVQRITDEKIRNVEEVK